MTSMWLLLIGGGTGVFLGAFVIWRIRVWERRMQRGRTRVQLHAPGATGRHGRSHRWDY